MKYSEYSNKHHMAVVYLILAAVFVTSLLMSLLIIVGYRVNLTKAQIEPIGVLQIRTRPNGNKIVINGREQGLFEGNRAELPAGMHNVSVTKSGYQKWMGDITLQSGRVKWLSVRLFPDSLVPEVVKSYPNEVRLTPLSKSAYLLAQLGKNQFEVTDFRVADFKTKPLNLNTILENANGLEFNFWAWSESRQQLWFKADNLNQDTSRLVSININDHSVSTDVVITGILSQLPTETVKLSNRGDVMYVLKQQDLYQINFDSANIAQLKLVSRKVLDYEVTDDAVLLIEQKADQSGYYFKIIDQRQQRTIIVDETAELPSLKLAYFNHRYWIGYYRTNQLMVFRMETNFADLYLPDVQLTTDLAYQKFLAANPKVRLVFNRFLVRDAKLIKDGNQRLFTVAIGQPIQAKFIYDLENGDSLRLTADVLPQGWFDQTNAWYQAKDGIEIKYFNDTNTIKIAKVQPRSQLILDNAQEAMYYLTTTAGRWDVNRISLLTKK